MKKSITGILRDAARRQIFFMAAGEEQKTMMPKARGRSMALYEDGFSGRAGGS
jgi:hypothetical protein